MWRIYFFPHFHYDIVWKFNREDYSWINEKILTQVVKLCKKFPDFKFGIESIYQLIEIEKKNPELFKEIKNQIKEGKIRVIDGQYLMADTFLSGGEPFLRGIIFGKRYFKEKFGKEIICGWITDAFGLNSQIPQIYKDVGYKWLAFGRGYIKKPNQSEFLWQGLDGTKILSHYFSSSHAYHVGLFTWEWERLIKELKKYAATKNILFPCGIGSCPFPVRTLAEILEWNKKHKEEAMRISFPEEFFAEVENKNLKTVKGEMYSGDRIFPGVWSTRIWLKLEYFKIKNLILNAEKFATISWLLENNYPYQEIKELWEKIFFLTFHDTLPGTSIDEVYDEVKEILKEIKEKSHKILKESLNFIASKVNVKEKGTLVFNPHPYPIESFVEDKENNALLKVKLPPLGYSFYQFPKTKFQKIVSQKGEIENEFLKVKLDKTRGTLKVFDKKNQKILEGNKLEIENESGSVYIHRDISKKLIGLVSEEGVKEANKPRFVIKEFKTEKGKNYQKISLKETLYGCFWPYRLWDFYDVELWRENLMEIEKEIKLVKGLPLVFLKLKIKNNYPHIRLRVRFDLNFEGKILAGTPFGAIFRKKFPFDYPMEDWIDYSNQKKGVTFITKGISGYQAIDNKVYFTLLRSINLISHGDKGPLIPVPDGLEIGKEFEYEYAILFHQFSFKKAKIRKQILNYLTPPILIEVKKNKGEFPPNFSFLSLPENFVLTCLKPAEDSQDLILRFFEGYGQREEFNLKIFKKLKQILISNITEEKNSNPPIVLPSSGRTPEKLTQSKIKIRPWQIATFQLKF